MSGLITLYVPILILIFGAFTLYMLSRLFKLSNQMESVLTALVLAGSLASLILIYQQMPDLIDDPDAYFGVMSAGGVIYRPNAYGVFILMIGFVIGILVTIYSAEYLLRDPRHQLFYPLLLMTFSGLVGIFFSNNLFNLFMLTELTTIAASALIAFRFHQEISIKAGFKYLIMSSIGTMMMLLGIYFVYRSTGEMHLFQTLTAPDNFTRLGAASFLLGFSLKAGVVPLHTWVPDVYGHAPSSVSGFLAGVLSKSMLFIMPVICLRLGMTNRELGVYFMIFSCANMLVGSIRLLRQPLLRRFLSFSTIGQTGYLMFGLGMGFYYNLPEAFSAALFLFLVIAVMKCLAFLSAGVLEYSFGTQDINLLRGFSVDAPFASLCFSIALAGLAGIPLLAGFTGKWMIFSAALSAGDLFSMIILMIFMLSSIISLGGYLPMIVKIYLPSEENEVRVTLIKSKAILSNWLLIPVVILSLLVVMMGIYPTPWINWINQVLNWMVI
jgi:formate hydrogenlyase subunit 3/multisubunit Na+/H+ antiporter MnhD subunit